MTQHLPVLPFLFPFVGALLCVVFGAWRPGAARPIALLALVGSTVAAAFALTHVTLHGAVELGVGGWSPPGGIAWLLDPLSALVALVVPTIALLVLGGSGAINRAEVDNVPVLFHACALLLVAGLLGMTLTHDLFNLYVFLEVTSLSAYALVAAGGRGAPRAALRYLVVGTVGASLYLLGVAFFYAATGTLNMADVAQRLEPEQARATLVGATFIAAGLGVKMGLFPLHAWMPAAYARAPSAASALMAPLVTKVSAYALLRVLFWVCAAGGLGTGFLLPALRAVAAVGLVVAAITAAMQDDLWRALAYSSISQMGLTALGLGVANGPAVSGAVLHILNDALMKGTLFLAAGVVLLRFGVRRVSELPRIRGRAPAVSAAFLVGGLSLVGLPPLCGFYGKWYVAAGALEAGHGVLAAAVLAGSLATAVYVFRILEKLFFATAEPVATEGPRAPLMTGACLTLTAGVVLLGLGNEPVLSTLVEPALPALSR